MTDRRAGRELLRSATPLKHLDDYLSGFHPARDEPSVQMEVAHQELQPLLLPWSTSPQLTAAGRRGRDFGNLPPLVARTCQTPDRVGLGATAPPKPLEVPRLNMSI